MGLFDSLFETESEQRSFSQTMPYASARPGINTAINMVADWMGTPREFFPGQTYAGMTPAQAQAIDQMKAGAGAAGELLPAMTGGYLGALGRPEAVLGQGLQDVASNPYLAGIADVMERRSEERMLEDVLPQMQAGAVARGGLGGSRLAIGAQQAERDRQRALDEALAGMYGQAWESGLGAETARYNQALAGSTAALGQTPAMLSAMQTPAQQLWGAGGRERAEEQLGINEAMQRFQFEQMEPFERASMGLGQLMTPGTAFAEGRRTTETKSTPSTFGQIGGMLGLGGALMGGISDMFPSAAPVGMGPFGGGGNFSTLPMGWGVSPYYGMPDPWGGAASYGMWG